MSSSPAAHGLSPIAEAAPQSLCAREPHVPADRLVAEMVPPPRFDSVRFDTYIPDPNQPSQTEAVRVLGDFAACLSSDWGLQLDPMKSELLVIADQHCCGEYVP
ncbi:hypothetical protein ABZS63_18120, partial [Streptomyces sp. NPDC005568]